MGCSEMEKRGNGMGCSEMEKRGKRMGCSEMEKEGKEWNSRCMYVCNVCMQKQFTLVKI